METLFLLCLQVVNKIMYTGSSDHTGRAWVTEFGDNTRIYKGHKHTVSVIKVYDGMGTFPDLHSALLMHVRRDAMLVGMIKKKRELRAGNRTGRNIRKDIAKGTFNFQKIIRICEITVLIPARCCYLV